MAKLSIDKCPNCGANLPRRVAGGARSCSYCRAEVNGSEPLVRLVAMPVAARPRPSRLWSVGIPAGVLVIFSALVLLNALHTMRGHATAGGSDEANAMVTRFGGWEALDASGIAGPLITRTLAQHPALVLHRVSFDAVRSNGRANLAVADATVRLEFIPRTVATPARGLDPQVDCISWIQVQREGSGLEMRASTETASHCRSFRSVTPPKCTLAEVWQRASAKGIAASAFATMSYEVLPGSGGEMAPGAPGRWHFYIAGTNDNFEFDDDCGTGS